MLKPALTVACPGCKVPVVWGPDAPYRPFCSLRCQQADFCAWASEGHVIPGDAPFDDVFSEDVPPSDGD